MPKSGRSRSGTFRLTGATLINACRTSQWCTPNFRDKPRIVPSPCSYSRRICSYSSTLLLVFDNMFVPPWRKAPGTRGTESAKGGANSDDQKGPIQSSELTCVRPIQRCVLRRPCGCTQDCGRGSDGRENVLQTFSPATAGPSMSGRSSCGTRPYYSLHSFRILRAFSAVR